LGVHLDALVSGERLPEQSPMLVERIRVSVPEFVQKLRRAFDVREEEGHDAGRKRGGHAAMILGGATCLLQCERGALDWSTYSTSGTRDGRRLRRGRFAECLTPELARLSPSRSGIRCDGPMTIPSLPRRYSMQ
jgi:hypothetical protein